MAGQWPVLLEQFWKLQYELPLFLLVIVFFVPLSLLTIGAVLFFAGGFVAGAKLPFTPKLAFLLPIEAVNAATAVALAQRFSYLSTPANLALAAAAFVAALAVAVWINRRQGWSVVLFTAFSGTYATGGVFYSAAQFLT